MPPRIDPTLAIVWRSEHQLQFGAPDARAVLDCPHRIHLDLVHLLRQGAAVETLETIAAAIGGSRDDVAAVLTALEPALVPPAAPARPARRRVPPPVVIAGHDRTAATIAGALGLLGHRVTRAPAGAPLLSDEPAHLVVLIEDRVIPTSLHLPLLRRDLPHLPVVFGDGDVTVGPLVVPGASACLRCVDLTRRDADEAWPLIAAQLTAQPAVPRAARLELSAAASAVRAIDARLTGHGTALDGVAEVIPRDGSRPQRLTYAPHPECGCGAHPETATARGLLAIRPRVAPSSARDGVVPA
jgi:bacteriocin biosynthesis cyclodehydratase domain-containing protein